MKTLIIIASLIVGIPTMALDRYAALSMIESGNNDKAVGSSGEVSRFQILPSVWNYQTNLVHVFDMRTKQILVQSPTNKLTALEVAMGIQSERQFNFYEKNKREPTDAEFYLLWHCPAHVLHPSRCETEIARRFANLCASP